MLFRPVLASKKTPELAKKASKMFSAGPFGQLKTVKNVFGRSIRTAKKASKMFSAGPFGQLQTVKNVFGRSIRTAKKASKMFSAGPFGQLKAVKHVFVFREFSFRFVSFRFVPFPVCGDTFVWRQYFRHVVTGVRSAPL